MWLLQTNQVKCYNANNIFFVRFVSSWICDDRVFFSQMTSLTEHHDIIFHPLPYQFSIFEDMGVDSPA